MLVVEPSFLKGRIELQKDEVVGLFGRNGAGKTTVMMTALCLMEGKVNLNGEDFCAKPDYTRIGYVSQNPNSQVLGETCEDEIEILSNFVDSDREIARKLMGDFFSVPFKRLSDGYKKRFVLSSALSTHPEYLLIDEPFANLDEEGISTLVKVIPRGTLLSEHRVKQTLSLIDRSYLIKDGNLVEKDKGAFLENNFLRREGLRGFEIDPLETKPSQEVLTQFRVKGSNEFLHKGESLCIKGKNGSGKTTTLKGLIGKKDVYVIFQNPDLQFFNQTVREEMKDPEVMKRLGLWKEADRSLILSHGEKMKVLIGSAISSKSRVIALDEPASGLDGFSLLEFRSILQGVLEEGRGVIITTNDDDIIPLCNRVIQL
ncbi:ATP-binding cassette domain-containing protein [Sulfuracidifex tepidarius]|uniref:ATP-binding cassette domain-containing protein n=1 Tax=Sulfuracidifex tepidarius TaxID=1294262 RepID=UPI0006D04FEA|nr:ATP-binding cassette domain-containing protein [Sulfuracidifex tepidarius]